MPRPPTPPGGACLLNLERFPDRRKQGRLLQVAHQAVSHGQPEYNLPTLQTKQLRFQEAEALTQSSWGSSRLSHVDLCGALSRTPVTLAQHPPWKAPETLDQSQTVSESRPRGGRAPGQLRGGSAAGPCLGLHGPHAATTLSSIA